MQSSRGAAAACRSAFHAHYAHLGAFFCALRPRHAADISAGVVFCADDFADGDTLGLLRRSVWACGGTAGMGLVLVPILAVAAAGQRFFRPRRV